MSFESLPYNERRTISSVLSAIEELDKEEPLRVIVLDEEDVAYQGPFNRTMIAENIGATDVTNLRIERGSINGQITMLHGEGDDFIQDISGRDEASVEFMERLIP